MPEVLIHAKDERHEDVELTDEQFHNHRKLAAYLLKVADTKHFDMGNFAYKAITEPDEDGFGYLTNRSLDPDIIAGLANTCKADHHECGTAGCAVGHALFAGIGKDDPDLKWLSWWMYADKYLGTAEYDAAFTWCFGPNWKDYDNTPRGAAKRILYMLDNGVPKPHNYINNITGYYDTDRYDPAHTEEHVEENAGEA